MALAYSTGAANARLTASLIATSTAAGVSVDGQAGFGQLVIGTGALSGASGVLGTVTAQKPSFSIASKVATMLGVPLSATATANGTAALAELRDSSGNTVVSGITVGVSGSNINLNSTTISTGETITVTSAAITHP